MPGGRCPGRRRSAARPWSMKECPLGEAGKLRSLAWKLPKTDAYKRVRTRPVNADGARASSQSQELEKRQMGVPAIQLDSGQTHAQLPEALCDQCRLKFDLIIPALRTLNVLPQVFAQRLQA